MRMDLDDNALQEVAAYFAALAVPARLRILNVLRQGERSVGELATLTGCSQANASKHLAVLSQSGLVAKTPRGTSAYYHIADVRIFRLCDMVCGQVGRRLEARAYLQPMLTRAARGTPRKKGRAIPR